MICYCKKCGRFLQNSSERDNYKCDCCETVVVPVPSKYLLEGFTIAFKNKEAENLLIEELVKTSPEFDQYLFDHREEILEKKSAELRAKIAYGKAIAEEHNRGVTCSYCGSKNVKRIGLLNRTVSTAFWGLSSKKIGKQWHCTHCNSDF